MGMCICNHRPIGPIPGCRNCRPWHWEPAGLCMFGGCPGIMVKLIDGPYSNKPPRGWRKKQEKQKAKLLKRVKK